MTTGPTLDVALLVDGTEQIAEPQDVMGLWREVTDVVQAGAGASGHGNVVHARLAVHPRRIETVLVFDRLRAAKAEGLVVGVGGGGVVDRDVEVVDARDSSAVVELEPLEEPLGAVGCLEELEGEPERVFDPDRLTNSASGAGRPTLNATTALAVPLLGGGEIRFGPYAESNARCRRLGALAQDEAVMGRLFATA